MKEVYYKEYSNHLGRDMEFKVYGHAGKPVLVFPSQDGRFFDFADQGMIDSCRDWIESGKLQFFCCDSIDAETWSDVHGDGRSRIMRHEAWYRYIVDELTPRIRDISMAAASHSHTFAMMATGCSMGGAHAANFFFRRPDLFDALISLSGIYNADFFFHGYMDDLVYQNSPIHYLRNMPKEHPYINLYRQRDIILCVGQGDWEEDMITSTEELEMILKEKNIDAWVDYWGTDVCHDWIWWKRQLPYFMEIYLKQHFVWG